MSTSVTKKTRQLFQAAAAVAVAVAIVQAIVSAQSKGTATRIAFVSVQRIAAQSTATQASGKRLQQFRDEKARAIIEKQKQVESLRLQIARSGGVFQTSRREKLRQDEVRALQELQRLQTESQTEVQKMQHDFQVELQQQLSTILTALAKQRGAELVLNQDTSVVFGSAAADWTADVVERMNAQQQTERKP